MKPFWGFIFFFFFFSPRDLNISAFITLYTALNPRTTSVSWSSRCVCKSLYVRPKKFASAKSLESFHPEVPNSVRSLVPEQDHKPLASFNESKLDTERFTRLANTDVKVKGFCTFFPTFFSFESIKILIEICTSAWCKEIMREGNDGQHLAHKNRCFRLLKVESVNL